MLISSGLIPRYLHLWDTEPNLGLPLVKKPNREGRTGKLVVHAHRNGRHRQVFLQYNTIYNAYEFSIFPTQEQDIGHRATILLLPLASQLEYYSDDTKSTLKLWVWSWSYSHIPFCWILLSISIEAIHSLNPSSCTFW